MEQLDLYEKASAWTLSKVEGAADKLDNPTPCDGWDVRTLLNHMLDTQRFFLDGAQGKESSPPAPEPPSVLSAHPAKDFATRQREMVDAFGEPGVIEKTGPSLGIAFADQLLHGWDLAKATAQDATMPAGLAEAAYETIHGRFTDDQRQGVFKPEVTVPEDASAQDKLLAYTGRKPWL